ncbi:MAG: hypothetical protein ABI120_17525 [Gemmatimonadaceae bacterium]
MSLAPLISSWLVQASTVRDTIVTIPARSWLDYTNGTLQLIVLVLAVVVLGTMAYLMISLKKGFDALTGTVEKLVAESRPIINQVSMVAEDAREVVAMIKTDVERVTDAASAVSEQLLDIAASTERRMDNINAVMDVVQGEIEETVLSTVATVRGVRLGSRAIAGAMVPRRNKPARAMPRARTHMSDEELEERERELERLEHNTGEHEREVMDRREARRKKREAKRSGERG